MESYYVILIVIGTTSLLASFLPILLKLFKISFTLPLLIFGAILYYLEAPLPWPDPVWPLELSLRFSELVVIISLMVAGLKIGLLYTWEEWKRPLSLLVITMPLFMLVTFLISHYLLKFDGPTSLLLAAVLAPTDPALASEIQLNEKQSIKSKESGVQYCLTAEAGLNDGLAFPFIFLAILWSQKSLNQHDLWIEWIGYYVIYKIIVGSLIGAALGYFYSLLTQKLSENKEKHIHQTFVAISLTLISYGVAEISNTYGFLSVFFTGLFAQYHMHIKSANSLSDPNLNFIINIEKFLIVFWIIFFGGSIMAGILGQITLATLLFSISLVLVIRPLMGYIGLFNTDFSRKKKLAISYLGVRGIGSVFYLTYAMKHGSFGDLNHLYSIVSLIILLSIIFHGLSAKRVLENT